MIKLRSFNNGDIPALIKNANNSKISRYLRDTFPYPYTEQDAEWWISKGSRQGINRAIIYQGDFAGTIGVTPFKGEKRHLGEIGYWLGEPFWGKGIAARAVQILTREVFETTNLQKLTAGVYSPNKASIRVLQKAGYIQEAVLKRNIIKNNEFYDEHVLVKFRQDLITTTEKQQGNIMPPDM